MSIPNGHASDPTPPERLPVVETGAAPGASGAYANERADMDAAIARLTAERDAAREYHGFQRGLRASLARDLDATMDLRVGLEAEVERLRARAERAEAALVRVRDLAVTWAAKAPEDDWGDTPSETVLADAGRDLLTALDGHESDAQPEPVPQWPDPQVLREATYEELLASEPPLGPNGDGT